MSVITEQMIKEYAEFFNIDLADGSQKPGIEGSLAAWEKGEGELVAELADRESFAPLKEAYLAAVAEGAEQLVIEPGEVVVQNADGEVSIVAEADVKEGDEVLATHEEVVAEGSKLTGEGEPTT